ncbi:hypothetical protein ACUWEX_11080 [Okibacterium fritillariae]|uniref:hypothetical protein n=1 Tax=Okibacterium fritillariae TaxID=123320 RepID=UPI00405539F4
MPLGHSRDTIIHSPKFDQTRPGFGVRHTYFVPDAAARFAIRDEALRLAALEGTGATLCTSEVANQFDKLSRALLHQAVEEIWHADCVSPASWEFTNIDALSLLIKIQPRVWRDLHAELTVSSMLWHDIRRTFPHANLLEELDHRLVETPTA